MGRLLIMGLLVLVPAIAAADALFLEAERADFDSGWQVKPHFTSWYLGVPSGVHFLAGTREAATARLTLEVPARGKYRLWVRYLELNNYRGPFRIRVHQGQRELADKEFDLKLIRPKRFARDFAVFVWDSLDVDCEEGKLQISIEKPASPPGSAWLNYHIDCVVLARDPDYLPQVTDFGPQFFINVRNTSRQPIYLALNARRYRRKYWFPRIGYVTKNGASRARPGDPSSYLHTGDESGWINITPLLDPIATSNVTLTGYTDTEGTPTADLNVKLLLGRAEENGKRIHTLKELVGQQDGARFIVQIEGHDAAGARTAAEIVEQKLQKIRAMGLRSFPRAKRFMLATTLALQPGLDPPQLIEKECEILRVLGFNCGWSHYYQFIQDLLDPEQKVVVHKFFFHLRENGANGSMNEPLTDKIDLMYADLARSVEENGRLASIRAVNVMDEPGPMDLTQMAGRDVDNAKFREYLHARGLSPGDFGAASWDGVKIITSQDASRFPELFYYSMHFRQKALADFFDVARQAVEKHFPRGTQTMTNFSDFTHPANMMERVDWFHLMRSSALTLGWTENWLNQLSTKQLSSYLIDALRCACKYNRQPIGAYSIAHRETPDRFVLKSASYVAHGARALSFFKYGPRYTSHGDDWSQEFDMYPAVASINRMIARVEDFLLDGDLAPAQCAILYPISSDVWQEGMTLGRERSFIYVMLLHRQVPVEILTEEDVENGALREKKVLFLTGCNLLPEAAAAIRDWVSAGGVLWSDAGAALFDQFNRPLDYLKNVLGLQHARIDPFENCGRGRIELPSLKAIEKATWTESTLFPAGDAEVFCVVERLTPAADAQVIGRFKDGSPAIILNRFGRGLSIRFCFLPGISYIKSAFPESYDFQEHGWTFNPTRFDTALLPLVNAAVRFAGVKPPVDLSRDVVEATLIRSRHGLIIPLVNWTFEPISELRVEIDTPLAKDARRAWSTESGNLNLQREGQKLAVTLPVKLADFVVMEFREDKDAQR